MNLNGISFEENHQLVRGLDYYCKTVFEFKTDNLGSQDTLIGGGRYDGLIAKLGGPNIPEYRVGCWNRKNTFVNARYRN